MLRDILSVAGDEDVFPVCSLDEINHIGHGCDSASLLEQAGVLDLEVLPFAESFVDRVALEHEGQLSTEV